MKKYLLFFVLLVVGFSVATIGEKYCWECYDGTGSCNKYFLNIQDEASSEAELFCEDNCNYDGSKCGVNIIPQKLSLYE